MKVIKVQCLAVVSSGNEHAPYLDKSTVFNARCGNQHQSNKFSQVSTSYVSSCKLSVIPRHYYERCTERHAKHDINDMQNSRNGRILFTNDDDSVQSMPVIRVVTRRSLCYCT